jgi:phosphate-selective porin OprO/OprP
MDSAVASQAFSIGRRVGIGQTYYFNDSNVRWFNGIFGANAVNTPKYSDDARGMLYNSRLTFVPVYKKDGERYFHFGGHYMYQENTTQTRNVQAGALSTPGSRIGGFNRATRWITPGAYAPHYHQGGLEMMWGRERLAFAGELFAGSFGQGRDMYGGYAEVKYFLTKGGVRPYNKRSGTLGGVKMKKNFLTCEECIQTCFHGPAMGYGIDSWGAFEVFAQWSFTDSDRFAGRDIAAGTYGRTTDTTIGLNWYWNPNTRWMFEYVHSDGTRKAPATPTVTDPSSRATKDIFAVSFRYHF